MIQELTQGEISMISGGDAGATRIAGQNAWGENVFGGYGHYWQVYGEGVQTEFRDRFYDLPESTGSGSAFKCWNAIF